MTDRDTFAAAALTGLLANEGDGPMLSKQCEYAYRIADAMLRERGRTNHDAAPAARASVESVAPQPTTRGDSARTDKAVPRPSEGTGDISEAQIDALECVVEDGPLRSLLVRPRPEWESDRPKPVKDAESDRSKPISDERLAALKELSALDQELELKHGIKGNPMIKAQQRTPPPRATPPQGSVSGDSSVPRSGTENEPVAWAVVSNSKEEIDCEFIYPDETTAGDVALDINGGVLPLYRHPAPAVTAEPVAWVAWFDDEDKPDADFLFSLKERADSWCRKRGAATVPLYLAPTLTDEEREAIHQAAIRVEALCQIGSQKTAATLRKLLERLK